MAGFRAKWPVVIIKWTGSGHCCRVLVTDSRFRSERPCSGHSGLLGKWPGYGHNDRARVTDGRVLVIVAGFWS